MTEKERKIPLRLRQVEALYNRLPKNHIKRSEIETERAIRRAGFRGEKNLDYHLSFLSTPNDYTIFKDIRMEEHKTFQIDTLLISPYFSLIIEVKNYSGILHIDPHTHQLIQNNGQNEKGYPNPVLQVMRQQKQLKDWLQKQKFDLYPVEFLVAFHEGSSIFKTSLMDKRIFNRIIYAENILHKVKHFERMYQIKVMDDRRIRKLKKLIIHHNRTVFLNILEQYGVSITEIISGVQCPNCQSFIMKYISASWTCMNCHTTSKTAHVKAIEELLLLNQFATNQQCRDFLHLTSSDTTYQLLKHLHLPFLGVNKGRRYHLPIENEHEV